MNSNKPFLISYFAFLIAASCPAQEEVPESRPTPAPPPANAFLSVSFIRLWYVGGPDSQRITVSLKSSTASKVLASHVRSGRLGTYRLAKPGQCNVFVLDGSVVPDATGKISFDSKPLVPPVVANLLPGAFHTIIVEENDGKMTTSVLEDKAPPKEAGPAFRIFDFSRSTNDFLKIIANDKSLELWNSTISTPTTKLITGFQGTASIQLGSLRNGEPVALNAYEAEIFPSKSYSIVLSFDRYGERTLSFVQDADSSASAEQIQEFLRGN